MRQIVFLQNALQVVSTRGLILLLPSALAVLSLSGVSWCFARRTIWESKASTKDSFLEEEDNSEGTAAKKGGIQTLDGFAVFSYRLLNLFCALILLSLQIYKLSIQETLLAERLLVVFYVYTSLLAIAAIISKTYWRDQCDFNFACLLFIDFCVYFVLDVWPYVTIHGIPYDWPGDITMWLRVSALTLSGLLIPLFAPRPFRPITPGMEPGITDTISLFNRYTYIYVDKIIFMAYQKPELSSDEIPKVSQRHKAAYFRKNNFSKLDPMLLPKKRHVIWGMLSAFRSRYVELTICLAIGTFTDFIAPFAMRNLLAYIETGESPFGIKPWFWVALLASGSVINALVFTNFFSAGFKISIEGESTLTQLVFEHALRIRLKTDVLASKVDKKNDKKDKKKSDDASPDGGQKEEEKGSAKSNQIVGKINNLITTDISTINTSWHSAILLLAVVQTVVAVVFLYGLLGWSVFAGYAAMAIIVPISALISKAMMKVQRAKMDKTDERVQSITESLGVIRMIKLFAWEAFTVKKVNEKRDAELRQVWKGKRLNVLLGCTNEAVPLVGKVTTFAVYALVMKGDLTASRIFSSLVVFGLLEQNLFIVMGNLPNLLRMKVSLDRFTEFFNKTVYLDHVEETAAGQPVSSGFASSGYNIPEDKRDVIGFNCCRFSWDPFHNLTDDTKNTEDTREQFVLDLEGEVLFKRNQFNIVVGSTASGKTSLLMALLGEMYFEPKNESSWWNLPREDGIAYAVQESWVLNKTIKDNIVFGEEFDEVRYKKVLKQCALEKDISLWKAGDETEVGEKGLTLSGGQKARVTLARALYSRASILLLDDVLAALDVHTAKWVVNEALRGDLVEGRTIILVTHNIALVAPAASHVVLMGKDGKAVATGTVADVLRRDASLRKELESQKASTEDIEEKAEAIADSKDTKTADSDAGKLVVAEEKAIGRVERAAFDLFFNAIGGPVVMSSFVFLHWLAMLVTVFERWFMGYWSSQYDYMPPDAVPVIRYIGILAIINFSQLLGHALLGVFWILRCLRASRIIYADLTRSIFSSTFRWLDVTPIGRIITRCTVDIDTIDGPFSQFVDPFIRVTLQVITFFVSSVIMAGWSAVIPGLILMGLGGFLSLVYLKAQLSIRREMSNAKAPVLNEVQAALASLPSIRAYGAQSKFRKEIQRKMDTYIRCAMTFYDINRWISIRADFLGAFFAGTVASYLVFYSGLSAGSIGFTLNLVLSFSELILSWVRMYNILELYGNSLERVLNYLRIDHEPANTESGTPPAYWPASGDLRVEHLSAKYSEDSPDVLHDISFEVKSGERVGIVGRTGAGKSSIALALLRAIKTDGKVYYDGLPTDTMNLDALRSNITLIPQQPELMRGTLRENLDPFGQLDDAMLNSALQAAGLFSIQDMQIPSAEGGETNEPGPSSEVASSSSSTIDGNSSAGSGTVKKTKIGLDTQVDAGGTNFSLGQRQIIALARAIIRRSKLLILDEATAAIDYETDTAIQKALRTEFSKDSTFLIIAHRLQTIVDSDKIMVLDHGKIVEFDSPKVLIQNKEGYLRSLVEESEDKDVLLKMIEKDL